MVEHHNKDREDSSSNSVRNKIKLLRTLRKKRKGRARVYLRLTY